MAWGKKNKKGKKDEDSDESDDGDGSDDVSRACYANTHALFYRLII
jgi:hypothetical protein